MPPRIGRTGSASGMLSCEDASAVTIAWIQASEAHDKEAHFAAELTWSWLHSCRQRDLHAESAPPNLHDVIPPVRVHVGWERTATLDDQRAARQVHTDVVERDTGNFECDIHGRGRFV